MWRGPALAEFGDYPFAQAEAARLSELRLAALEARIEAELSLGQHDELVALPGPPHLLPMPPAALAALPGLSCRMWPRPSLALVEGCCGWDPVQRLRLLAEQAAALDNDDFDFELAATLTSLRDTHTRYIGPAAFCAAQAAQVTKPACAS